MLCTKNGTRPVLQPRGRISAWNGTRPVLQLRGRISAWNGTRPVLKLNSAWNVARPVLKLRGRNSACLQLRGRSYEDRLSSKSNQSVLQELLPTFLAPGLRSTYAGRGLVFGPLYCELTKISPRITHRRRKHQSKSMYLIDISDIVRPPLLLSQVLSSLLTAKPNGSNVAGVWCDCVQL